MVKKPEKRPGGSGAYVKQTVTKRVVSQVVPAKDIPKLTLKIKQPNTEDDKAESPNDQKSSDVRTRQSEIISPNFLLKGPLISPKNND